MIMVDAIQSLSHLKCMTFSTQDFIQFLGQPADKMLGTEPFKKWPFNASIVSGLDEPATDYVFFENGMDVMANTSNVVTTVFLFCDQERVFSGELTDLAFSMSQSQVRSQLGPSSKNGEKTTYPGFGDAGAWDRYDSPGYSIHIEYNNDESGIRTITFMHESVVP